MMIRALLFTTASLAGVCGLALGADPAPKAEAKPEQKVFTQEPKVANSRVADPKAEEARDVFNLLPGFKVELLYTVPKEALGSWVNITTDPKGRLIVSDQGGLGLCRVTPPSIGSSEPTKVERIDAKIDGKVISGAQGLVWAFDSLYVVCNGGPGSGLYRVRDTNGDDQLDEVVRLKTITGSGEHGPHAVRVSPDGKSLFVCAGNHTRLPFELTLNTTTQTMGGPRNEQLRAQWPAGGSSRLMPNWDEDLLLPRQWDGNGHARGILAPGGWVAKTDPDGKNWEVISSGYRNEFDFGVNADGEIFVYDADMEWDVGSPWYRPTRVSHATSGSEFGWRSGTGKWPVYYPDSLPPLVEIGPGSPVGVEFGYGAKFPAKYQKALYICDWTFATIYAIHMEPDGASYKAVKEEFVSRTPLPLTDVTVAKDGAMYFTIGGRGNQSELYRVTYVGDESTVPAELKSKDESGLRELRHEIEAYHEKTGDAKAVAFLVPQLSHKDRFISYAARVALERIPVDQWQEAALAASNPEGVINAVVGLARQADKPLQGKLISALDKVDYSKLSPEQQLAWLRAYQLIFIRLGLPAEADRAPIGAKFDLMFPGASDFNRRELAILMIALDSPNAANLLVPLLTKERQATQSFTEQVLKRNAGYGGAIFNMLKNQPDQQQYTIAFDLKSLKKGWTPEYRKIYFGWFEKARKWSGGNSYQKFLANIDAEAFASATDNERLTIEATGLRKPWVAPPLPKPKGPGRDYALSDVIGMSDKLTKNRNFKHGEKMFAAARCVVCHRFGGDGGATGPDLTQLAGRFNLKDLSESILDPSKVISDQYKASVVQTDEGKVITGRIVSESKDTITMVVDPENSSKILELKKAEIEATSASPVSLMPKDLLKTMNEEEVLDLFAYLLSRGNPRDPMFAK